METATHVSWQRRPGEAQDPPSCDSESTVRALTIAALVTGAKLQRHSIQNTMERIRVHLHRRTPANLKTTHEKKNDSGALDSSLSLLNPPVYLVLGSMVTSDRYLAQTSDGGGKSSSPCSPQLAGWRYQPAADRLRQSRGQPNRSQHERVLLQSARVGWGLRVEAAVTDVHMQQRLPNTALQHMF